MTWQVEFLDDAEEDLKSLDHSVRVQVLKGIEKAARNLLPNSKGDYGEPLENKPGSDLTNFLKMKFRALGIRVVYKIEITSETMKIIIISLRNDDFVYEEAEKRINKL